MTPSQDEITTILNGIRDFILVISPDREILEANEAFLQHMNYTRSEVIGRKCHDIYGKVRKAGSDCHERCPLEKVVREKHYCREDFVRIDKEGRTRYMEVSIFPIWEKKGKIARFIEISRDISKRKTNEMQNQDYLVKMVEERTRQLKDSHERLLHQDKMASLGKLSSSVVHEINNPVAGILNLVMLSQRILKEDEIKQDELDLFIQYLGLMETETRRIGRIVSNLLVFARQSKMEMIKFDVNELIEQSLILNSNLLKINGIRVIEELERNLPLVTGSEDQLKQVVMNLISNAVESMSASPTKRLTIKTFSKKEREGKEERKEEEEEEEEERGGEGKKAVGIQVSDTGTGIPDETVSKIFEPFYTTKKKGKGVGLGLSVVYGIIKEHGGKMFVDSTLGKGSRFSITLFQEPVMKEEESRTLKDLK